jgi:hypothetical protein
MLLVESLCDDRPQTATFQRLRHVLLCFGVLCVALLGACGGGGGGSSVSDPVDSTVPTLTITSDAPPAARAPFKLTFTFSGPVTFPASDGVLAWSTSNANASADRSTFTRVSATQYTVTVTPNSARKGDWTLTVPAGGYRNQSGNATNGTAVAVTQAIDAMPPIGTFRASLPPGQLVFTGPTTVTLSFDLPLDADLTLDKLVASSADPSSGTPNAAGSVGSLVRTSPPGAAPVYTFVYTPVRGDNVVTVGLAANAVFSGTIANAVVFWGPVRFIVP